MCACRYIIYVRGTHVHTHARVSSSSTKLKLVLLYHSYSLPLKELIVTDQQLHEDRFDKFEDPFGHIWYISRHTHIHTHIHTRKTCRRPKKCRSALLSYIWLIARGACCCSYRI